MVELAVLRACRQALRLGCRTRLRCFEHVVLVHGLLVRFLAKTVPAVVHGGDVLLAGERVGGRGRGSGEHAVGCGLEGSTWG